MEATATGGLEQAFKSLDFTQPLMPGDPRLAEDLFDQFLSTVETRLCLMWPQPSKLLLHGHIGSGKSTFLNLLEVRPRLNEKFLVVRVAVTDVADPNDIDVIDLLLGMATAALQKASQEGVDVKEKDLRKIAKIVKQLKGLMTTEVEGVDGTEASISAEAGVTLPALISWLRGSFLLNYKASVERRRVVRETMEPQIGSLIQAVNDGFSALESRLGRDRRLLFLVHDTDKPVLDRALRLFDTQGYQLGQTLASAVFVVDKALACSGRFASVTNRLGVGEPFPAFKVVEHDGARSEKTDRNRRLLGEMLLRRLPEECASTDAKERIIELGGGICRETLRLAQNSVFKALTSGRPRVEVDDVDYAEIVRANEFSLTRQEWKLLEEVCREPDWCPPTIGESVEDSRSPLLRLLYMLGLIEYTNGEARWLRPHPVLLRRLGNRQ